MKAEEKARQKIDELLIAAGWVIQDRNEMNIAASIGVAIREFPLPNGFADYLLFVNGKAVGVIEAKHEGTTLSGVADQSQQYINVVPDYVPHDLEPLPFAYESTGVETFFRDIRDPDTRSRRVFAFHKPATLGEWASQSETLRARLKKMPLLIKDGLRECQIEAITNLDRSFAESRPKALIQMATGSGKTFTAVSFIYRLIKYAGAKRVLFLVDRSNLGKQTLREFDNYQTPDDGRRFTQLYGVQRLSSNSIDMTSKVCITTIQRLYSILRGEAEYCEENEEPSMFEMGNCDERPKEVAYTPNVPLETFDFIVTDECHRSIYNVWRQALEYFDGFIIGLTATPSKQTFGFFNQNLVMEYSHDRAVADGVNVGYEVYRIKTEISQKGSKVDAGYYVDKRDKMTRRTRWEKLSDDYEYQPGQLDRDVVAPDQIRTVVRAFRDHLYTDIFPGRAEVPKTLIFAKNDSHAEDIVHIVREEFGKGNDFCKKITYRTTGEKPDDLIKNFQTLYNPRIAVTVDMIAAGTDIKPLECIMFMRDVKSSSYFEQMKGRATRTISSTDFRQVTPDAYYKTHFVIVDAVGVCESDKTDSKPLERKRGVSFEKLLERIALHNRDEDLLSSLVYRLSMLDKALEEKDRVEISAAADGKSLKTLINGLMDAIDPDKKEETAKVMFKTDAPTEEQLKKATEELAAKACEPFDVAKLRNTLIDVKKRNEQVIDTISKDNVVELGFRGNERDWAEKTVETLHEFIEKNKDEITALQIIYNMPYSKRHVTYEEIKLLADAIKKPPYNLTPELVWQAYEQLERSKVKGAGPQKLLTNIISLVRFATHKTDILEPFPETVDHKFNAWMFKQEVDGRIFSIEQKEWLKMIKEHIATSLSIGIDDFELTPFDQKGGTMKVSQLFGPELNNILEELNNALVS